MQSLIKCFIVWIFSHGDASVGRLFWICDGRIWSTSLRGEKSTVLMTNLSLQDQDCILIADVQLVNHCQCRAPVAGLELLLDSQKVFVWPELKSISQFILSMSLLAYYHLGFLFSGSTFDQENFCQVNFKLYTQNFSWKILVAEFQDFGWLNFKLKPKYARILLFQFVFTKYVFGFRNYDGLIFVTIMY